MSQTTILVDTETREDLRNIGRKGQTYDSLIRELIILARRTMKIPRAVKKENKNKRVGELQIQPTHIGDVLDEGYNKELR